MYCSYFKRDIASIVMMIIVFYFFNFKDDIALFVRMIFFSSRETKIGLLKMETNG